MNVEKMRNIWEDLGLIERELTMEESARYGDAVAGCRKVLASVIIDNGNREAAKDMSPKEVARDEAEGGKDGNARN